MKVRSIPSSWIIEEEHRLDCGPFTSGRIEIKKRLDSLSCKKQPLEKLTLNGMLGIYHVGQEKLRWVDTAEYGVPFLTSSDILKADLSQQPFISKEQVSNNQLFQCPPGTTLISRSGTIGRTVYARSDIAQMAISQDVLKVVADPDKIRSGYLYAYLSSKFGLPLLIGGTFGSIIVHIEGENIADAPVPRLGNDIEKQAHSWIESAAQKRVEAADLIKTAIQEVERKAGLPVLELPSGPMPFSITTVQASQITKRMDAFFHSPYHNLAVENLRAGLTPTTTVDKLSSEIYEPNRLKRVAIEDPTFGVPFFGTSALMYFEPVHSYYLPQKQKSTAEYLVSDKTLLIPRSGQLSGLIGTPVLPFGDVVEGAVSEHAIRVECESTLEAGYLFIALNSQYGIRQLKARAYGSSIPSLDVRQVSQVLVPDPGRKGRESIGKIALHAISLRNEAISLEAQARKLVEEAIEGRT